MMMNGLGRDEELGGSPDVPMLVLLPQVQTMLQSSQQVEGMELNALLRSPNLQVNAASIAAPAGAEQV